MSDHDSAEIDRYIGRLRRAHQHRLYEAHQHRYSVRRIAQASFENAAYAEQERDEDEDLAAIDAAVWIHPSSIGRIYRDMSPGDRH